jgi:hypothetical protein
MKEQLLRQLKEAALFRFRISVFGFASCWFVCFVVLLKAEPRNTRITPKKTRRSQISVGLIQEELTADDADRKADQDRI